MNLKKILPRAKGQTIVEFAIVLPVLLLVVIGLIEVGRLIFIYGSVVTASRQAVRYGSATGFNESGTRKYLDCTGIQNEAERMGFIAPISQVNIIYTRAGATIADCDSSTSGIPNPSTGLLQNGDRIEVSTTSAYGPMISIVPFDDFNITTTSKRTIFIGIVIMSTPGPALPQPSMTLTMEAFESDGTTPKTEYSGPGDEVVYKYTIQNTSDTYALSSLEITDSNGSQICTTGSLAALGTYTCTGSVYTITAGDEALIDGSYSVTKTSYGVAYYDGTPINKTAGAILSFVETAALEISIVADPAYTNSTSGSIDFDITITNTGNVPISTFSIASQNLSTFNDCSAIAGDLAAGSSAICTARYTIAEADIDPSGLITYTATVQAVYGADTPVSPAASASVNTRPISLSLPIVTPGSYTITPYEGISRITYTFQALNNTPDTLSSATLSLRILDASKIQLTNTSVTCGTGTLASNVPTNCVGSYDIQQTDLDNGKIYIADAQVTATHPTEGPMNSNLVAELSAGEEIVVNALAAPALTLTTLIETIDGDAPGTILASGATIPNNTTRLRFTYAITNSGNITIPAGTNFKILVDGSNFCTSVNTLSSALLPTYTTTGGNLCVRDYSISAPELAAGQLNKNASAEMTSIAWAGTTKSATSTAVPARIYTYPAPRFDLTMSAVLNGSTTLTGGETIDKDSQITFTYTFKNTGNANISPAYIIGYRIVDSSGTLNSTLNCTTSGQLSANIPPGGTGTCTNQIAANNVGAFSNTAMSATANLLPANSLPASMSFTVKKPLVCNVSATSTSTGSEYTHTWNINNQSGTTVTLSSLTVTWGFKNLTGVTLNGTSIYSSSTSSSPYPINNLTKTLVEGNNPVVLSFSHKNNPPSISASFVNDPLCAGYTAP